VCVRVINNALIPKCQPNMISYGSWLTTLKFHLTIN